MPVQMPCCLEISSRSYSPQHPKLHLLHSRPSAVIEGGETMVHRSVSPSRTPRTQGSCSSRPLGPPGCYVCCLWKEQVVLIKMLRTEKTSGSLGQCWKGWDRGSVEGWEIVPLENSCLASSMRSILRTHI